MGPFTAVPHTPYVGRWRAYLAHDFGSSAPSLTLLMTHSPGEKIGERYYPHGSIIIPDELAAYRRDNLNTGLGWTAAVTAEAIRSEPTAQWGMPALRSADAPVSQRPAPPGHLLPLLHASRLRPPYQAIARPRYHFSGLRFSYSP